MVITDRKAPPRIVDAVEFNLELKQYEKYYLKNGVPVYSINAGAEDVMMVELVFFAGNCFEDKNLVAASANYLLKNGTSKKNAFQLNEFFDYYGSYLNRACYNETATVSLHCLNKHIAGLLPVVEELITDPVFPDEEIAIYKQNMKQRLSVNMKKSDFTAGRLIDAYLYGEQHPYGKYTSAEAYDALTRDELVEFYKKWYEKGQCIIFTAGRLPKNLPELLEKHFGSLPLNAPVAGNVPYHDPEPLATIGKPLRVVNDEHGVQGSIRIARPFPNRHDPDFQKSMVLNNIFGGYFGSRLMKNIREEKGYTYGIYSYLQNHVQHSAWMISTEVGKDVCEAAIVEIYKEMKVLRDDKIGDDEMMLVRNYMIGGLLGELDGPFQIIARWKNLVLNGLDKDYFYKSIEIIKTISPEELRDLANKYLQPENFYELVVI
jgi:zinc protease